MKNNLISIDFKCTLTPEIFMAVMEIYPEDTAETIYERSFRSARSQFREYLTRIGRQKGRRPDIPDLSRMVRPVSLAYRYSEEHKHKSFWANDF